MFPLQFISEQVVEVYWLLHFQLGTTTEKRRDEAPRVHHTDDAVEEAERCNAEEDMIKPSRQKEWLHEKTLQTPDIRVYLKTNKLLHCEIG